MDWSWLFAINEFFSRIGIFGVIVGAIVGWFLNWKIASSRVDADLKAKTRLEWIKEVRQLTAEIINSYYTIIRHYNDAISKDHPRETISYAEKSSYKKLSKEVIKLSNNINLFELYFSTLKIIEGGIEQDNSENVKLRKDLRDLQRVAVSYKIALDKPFKFEIRKYENDDELEAFRDNTSDYLKREWDRAKNNK